MTCDLEIWHASCLADHNMAVYVVVQSCLVLIAPPNPRKTELGIQIIDTRSERRCRQGFAENRDPLAVEEESLGRRT